MPSQMLTFNRMTLQGMVLTPIVAVALLAGCESKSVTEEAKQAEKPAAGAAMDQVASEPMETTAKQDMPMQAQAETEAAALSAPVSSAGQKANAEGLTHARQGHWDVAEGHFRNAVEADPKLAEAHYNLGLALDKLDRHDEAKVAFGRAVELAPENSMITESPVLQKHMST